MLVTIALLVVAAGAFAAGATLGAVSGGTLALGAGALVLAMNGQLIPAVLVSLPPWGVGRMLGSRRRLVRELRERTAELERQRDAHAHTTVQRERARMARELHDVVAHHLTVMVLLAGAGRLAPADRAGATARLADIRTSGELAIAELDRLVELLQPAEERRATAPIDELLTHAQAAGVACRWSPPPGGVPDLPPPVQEAVYRVVQEGVTNALKHAPGAEVHVRLAVDAHAVEVEVTDTGAAGPPADLASAGSGLGLHGMRERVESLGGRLTAGPSGDGWTLQARFPVT